MNIYLPVRPIKLIDNLDAHASVCGLFASVLFMMLCGFVQAKLLNLGVLLMIVHPDPRFGRHCFYLRCCRVFFRLFINCRSGNTAVSILLDLISCPKQGVMETNAR